MWTTDTCGLWLHGLSKALEEANESQATSDVFWLVPGDFYYATEEGAGILREMPRIPEAVHDGSCELCIGELTLPPDSSKQLIDTYGVWALLYDWFPSEATGMRAKGISKPRSEFFAIGQAYLRHAMLENRWFGYEQTVALILQAMNGNIFTRAIDRVPLGNARDPANHRSSLKGALDQIERTERLLKFVWRHKWSDSEWEKRYRPLNRQSAEILTSASIILQRMLDDDPPLDS